MHEQIQDLPLDLIDDPQAPMRSQIDDEKLEELLRSIKQHGLIQPITVRQVGLRYEVVAGHRRYKACKRAGFGTIAAIVRVLNDAQTDAMRVHENLYRDDINPVDEARYIRRMIDLHHTTPEQLANMTGKSEAYLQARYNLLDYPDYLVEAVENGKISLSAAQWLSKITDDRVCAEYTRFGILGGITAKRAEAWFRSWEAGNLPREASAYQVPLAEPSAESKILSMPCILCRHEDNIEHMGMYYAHQDCERAAAKMLGGSES